MHIIHLHVMEHLEANKILVDNQHDFCNQQFHNSPSPCMILLKDLRREVCKGLWQSPPTKDSQENFTIMASRQPTDLDQALLVRENTILVVNGAIWDPVRVISSVPQGTVTGPLDFLLYTSKSSKVIWRWLCFVCFWNYLPWWITPRSDFTPIYGCWVGQQIEMGHTCCTLQKRWLPKLTKY